MHRFMIVVLLAGISVLVSCTQKNSITNSQDAEMILSEHQTPKILPNIQLTVDNEPISTETKAIELTLENLSSDIISTGSSSEFCVKLDGEWYEVPFNETEEGVEYSTTDIKHNIEPGSSRTFTISLDRYRKLDAGKYRILKEIDSNKTAIVDFNILVTDDD